MADVVVAVSAVRRQWATALKGYIQDHAQAMTAMSLRDPTMVTEGMVEVDVVVLDDVVTLFDAAAIGAAGYRDIRFIGLTDESGGRGRAYLEDLGVDLILPVTSSPAEIVAAIRTLVPVAGLRRAQTAERPARVAITARDLRPLPVRPPAGSGPGRRGPANPLTVIQKCCGGVGASELAVLLAERFAPRSSTLLIEADETGSSLVDRLGLGHDRCLPHALGLVAHGHHLFPDGLSVTLADGQPHPRLSFDVIAGAMTPGGPPPNNPVHFRALLETATATYLETVVQVGPLMSSAPGETNDRFATGRAAVAAGDRLVAITAPTPNGVTRLVNWLSAARAIAPDTPAFAVFGLVPRSRFVRGALRRELDSQTDALAFQGFETDVAALLPLEKAANQATWDGTRVPRGTMRRAANALADHLAVYPAVAHSVMEPTTNGHRPRRAGANR